MAKIKMTTEEAFVKVLQMHGIEHAFGIIGSAMMPISDLFPKAGITFWDCAHEGNAGMMADGFTRASGKMSMLVAQNGPGITNFVTPVKTAYWNHTPLLLITPQAANMTMGQGGFQEVPQMAIFKDMVAYQEEVLHPSRMAEVLNRVIMQAKRASAPGSARDARRTPARPPRPNKPAAPGNGPRAACGVYGTRLGRSKNCRAGALRSAGTRYGVCARSWRDAAYLRSKCSRAGGPPRPGRHRLSPGLDVAVDWPGRTGRGSLSSQFS